MRVLITGATGFLGTHIAALLLNRGHQVRALIRSTSNTRRLEEQGEIELVVGNLEDRSSLSSAMNGMDAVVHCAGGGMVASPGDFFRQNTVPCEMLLTTARMMENPPTKWILISSIAAVGPAIEGTPLNESSQASPISLYGQSKQEAEKLFLQAQPRFQITIIRPPAIYGPGDTRFLGYFKSIRRGWCPLPPGRLMSLVYGEDCAWAVALALEVSHPNGRIYFVEDGNQWSWEDLADIIYEGLSRHREIPTMKSIHLAPEVIYLVGLFNELKARITGKPTLLTRDKWRDGKEPYWLCDSELIRQELGWEPKTKLSEGVQATCDWYLNHQWL